jgi:uncharacterized membrane protein
MMSVISMPAGETRAMRWLTLASLALNLFLIGAAGALAVRHYVAPAATSAPVDRSVAGRIGRIAATLPTADADILRTAFAADGGPVTAAQAALRKSQEDVRQALRAEPLDLNALRGAMAETRDARQNFDRLLYDLVATAAAKMTVAGRNKLADWPGTRNNATNQSRTGEAGR